MSKRMLIIRTTLWWGIIADSIETVRMSLPQLFIKSTGANVSLDNGFRFALLYGAPVMLGWVVLLLWTNNRPVERRGVFLCLIPVILSYFVIEIVGIQTNVLSLNKTMPTFILQTILLALSIVSYFLARRITAQRE